MEQTFSLATHMGLEVKITCGGITRIVVSRRGLSTSEISMPLRYCSNYSFCCVNVCRELIFLLTVGAATAAVVDTVDLKA